MNKKFSFSERKQKDVKSSLLPKYWFQNKYKDFNSKLEEYEKINNSLK